MSFDEIALSSKELSALKQINKGRKAKKPIGTIYNADNKNDIDTASLTYFTLISGKFNIYDYDCGSTVAETVEGSFQVYYSSGIVFFIKTE